MFRASNDTRHNLVRAKLDRMRAPMAEYLKHDSHSIHALCVPMTRLLFRWRSCRAITIVANLFFPREHLGR